MRVLRRAAVVLAAPRVGRRLSLRARLLLGLIGIAAAGLFVADLAIYFPVRAYLLNQANTQLVSAATNSVRLFARYPGGPGPDGTANGGAGSRLPLNIAIEVVQTSGRYVESLPSSFRLLVDQHTLATARIGSTFTVPGKLSGASGTYLVTPRPVTMCQSVLGTLGAFCLPDTYFTAVALVATPLDGLQGTLARLLAAEILVSVAVLVALVFLGYGVVRVGLRPLLDIEETAGKIAAGDLSRRVAREDETTEVGRLGRALNAMLQTIEHGYHEREASEERLRRFLADASHELRTPVTSIRGYAELFRRGAAAHPDDVALAMRRIEEESQRMGGLVEDLLLLARLDQGRPLRHERVDLAALAIDAAADAQVVAPEREITADAPAPVVVLGDEERLRQVVANLVQNALRHTPPGTPVTVAVGASEAVARLSVRDEGPGLRPADAARVFERFFRADPSRARGSGGSGLGLSIVASIAQRHGGRARVVTAPGEGADFIVELPLAPAEDARLLDGSPPGAPTPAPQESAPAAR